MDKSEIFTIVADAERRQIIQTLLENDGQTTLNTLSTRLASHRQKTTLEVNERKQAKIHLLHNHLPRLQDHGVIEYDRQSGDVELDTSVELEPYVAAASPRSRFTSPE